MQYLSEGVDSGRPDVSFVYKAELLMPSCELGFGLAGDVWLWRQKDVGSNHDSVIHFLCDCGTITLPLSTSAVPYVKWEGKPIYLPSALPPP